jgi:hypothetical protein
MRRSRPGRSRSVGHAASPRRTHPLSLSWGRDGAHRSRGGYRLGRRAGAEAETSASRHEGHASALLARCSRLTRRADARDHRVLPVILATTHVEGKAITRRAELRSAPPAGDASAGALAVAGLVDQRRRERRLIQNAPADSATRTPIHPAKRSSEDRCIVSGSSIDGEGIPDGAWPHRRREPSADVQEREPAVCCADLTAGALKPHLLVGGRGAGPAGLGSANRVHR